MPLTGELEHLPIVDVIQLIHSTRKSGTLNVYSRKGEGQLVFNNGYIIGATHSNEKLRIGQILLEAEIVSTPELDKALKIQEVAGSNRKPLIATLVENCEMSEAAAFKALERLIEMTVVEMISWSRGLFSLDIDKILVCDDYQYLPPPLQEVNLDTQMVLLDALRIFDEKVHAGEIKIVDEPLEEEPDLGGDEEPDEGETEEIIVSEDILGLADLDQVKHKKPRVFKSLESFDPTEIHRQVISKALPDIDLAQQDRLIAFLIEASMPKLADDGTLINVNRSQAIIMHSQDEFIQHAIMTICKKEGILIFAAETAEEIDGLIERAQERHLDPILVFGCPEEGNEAFTRDTIAQVRNEKHQKFPQVSIIQLAFPCDYSFALQSLNDGIRAVLPKPYYKDRQETIVEDIIDFLNTFQSYVRACFSEDRRQKFAKLRNSLSGLRLLKKAPDISLSVLQFVAEIFERSLTLIVDKTDLISERSIGISHDKSQGPAPPLKFRIPILDNSFIRTLIKERKTYFGPAKDSALEECLYPEIGAPLESQILLLPLISNDRVITLTYADFGNEKIGQVPLDFLEFFASQAGISMENALFRKQMGKNPIAATSEKV